MDLSSLTKDQARAPCSGSGVFTTGLPGKSLPNPKTFQLDHQ